MEHDALILSNKRLLRAVGSNSLLLQRGKPKMFVRQSFQYILE